MSETWERARRRSRLVEDVLRDVDRSGIAALADWDAPIKDEYGDEGLGGFLTDVHRRWQRTFDARLDGVLETDGPDLPQAVARLWQHTSEDLSGTRAVLDAHAEHPVLARLRARHLRMLEAATGVGAAEVQPDPSATRPTHGTTVGATHGREHRPQRARLRLRPLCARLHRRPVSAA